MELGDLKTALAGEGERPWGGVDWNLASEGAGDQGGRSMVEDIFRRHGRSVQGESRRICAMLKAMVAALEVKQMEPKPAALFAALVLALEGIAAAGDGAGSPMEVEARSKDEAALLYLLEEAASRMQMQAVQMKFARSIKVVCKVLETKVVVHQPEKPSTSANTGTGSSQTQCAKFGVGCLSTLLCAHDPSNFLQASSAFGLLLSFSTDPRPKVRKRAQAGLSQVVRGMGQGLGQVPGLGKEKGKGNAPSLQHASRMVFEFGEQSVRELVEVTKAYENIHKEKSKKEARKTFEHKLQLATTRTFHVLGALKEIVGYLDPTEVLSILGLLDSLLDFKEVLLAHHTSLVLERFFQSSQLSYTMKPQALATLLQNLIERLLIIEDLMADSDIASSTLNMLLSGFRALNRLDSELCLECIPRLFHQCLHYFRRKDSEVFRIKVSSVLSELMDLCITDEAVRKALICVQSGDARHKKQNPVLSIITGVEAMLTVPYQDSWNSAFQLISKLALVVGDKHGALMKPMLQEVGLLAAGPENEWTEAIQECVGNAVRALGPECILDAIPLNIEDAVENGTEANSWLVFILKKNVHGASLEFWSKTLLPLARKVGEYASQLSSGEDVERAVLLAALEHQIWQTLPSFCRWSSDTAIGFKSLARSLGAALQNREDLRNYICNAITCIVKQNQTVLREAQENKDVFDGQSVSGEGSEFDFDESFPIPEFYDEDFAKANLDAVASFAKNFLPLLFNLFVSSRPSERGQIYDAIAAFGTITDSETLDGFYKNILKRMANSLQTIQSEGDKSMRDASIEQQGMLMDIAAALVPGLKREALEKLLSIVNVSIVYKDSGIQKKSYKLLFCMLKRSGDLKPTSILGIQESLSNAQGVCYAPAKKNRLLCVRAMISIIDSRVEDKEKDQETMTAMVTEIVMCTKEKNSKTHKAALDLLADIASSFKGLESVNDGPLLEPGPLGFINVVAGGLVASHPHMISATIVALTRLVYQYSDEIGPEVVMDVENAVSMLLKTKSREVVKSVLAFLSMYVTTIDGATLHGQLPKVIESLLIWANDTKNRFRLKIRHILEKVIRTLGIDEVTKYIPEEHLPLIRHIRKQKSQEKRKREGSVAGFSVKTRETAGKRTTWTYMEDEANDMGDNVTSSKFGATTVRSSGTAVRKRARRDPGGGLNDLSTSEPANLLDNREMVKMNARNMPSRGDSDSEDDIQFKTRKKDGKLIIKDDKYEKRERGSDEEMDDRRSVRSGRTARTSRTSKSGATMKTNRTSKTHASGKTIVKTKGTKKLEPFAYWPMDRKMLNRRAAKRKDAKKGLLHVVKSKGAKKGKKSNR
ncbi:NUC173 domain-containing protein [Chloropicon primus]|uniref:NUC173 domain-containing protein n=2 Tax=Chloropicon primus TaxID=1764295 RepID=A0A5B8MY95_9CHLO|nr:NUC173 domain-containing protein [Chloropicon primus]UPR04295.1 NUC173 domain-containing protein [Chloropicon primus]|eukprot:QDZ25086.1 NUC173 domain-containing protein [Chloropicon primus]